MKLTLVRVSSMCYQSMPCRHDVKLLTPGGTEVSSRLTGPEIYDMLKDAGFPEGDWNIEHFLDYCDDPSIIEMFNAKREAEGFKTEIVDNGLDDYFYSDKGVSYCVKRIQKHTPFIKKFYYAGDNGTLILPEIDEDEWRYLSAVKVFKDNKLILPQDIEVLSLYANKSDKPFHRWHYGIMDAEKMYNINYYYPFLNQSLHLRCDVRLLDGAKFDGTIGFEIMTEKGHTHHKPELSVLSYRSTELCSLDKHTALKDDKTRFSKTISIENGLFTGLYIHFNCDEGVLNKISGYFTIKAPNFEIEGPLDMLYKIKDTLVYYNNTNFEDRYKNVFNIDGECSFEIILNTCITYLPENIKIYLPVDIKIYGVEPVLNMVSMPTPLPPTISQRMQAAFS